MKRCTECRADVEQFRHRFGRTEGPVWIGAHAALDETAGAAVEYIVNLELVWRERERLGDARGVAAEQQRGFAERPTAIGSASPGGRCSRARSVADAGGCLRGGVGGSRATATAGRERRGARV